MRDRYAAGSSARCGTWRRSGPRPIPSSAMPLRECSRSNSPGYCPGQSGDCGKREFPPDDTGRRRRVFSSVSPRSAGLSPEGCRGSRGKSRNGALTHRRAQSPSRGAIWCTDPARPSGRCRTLRAKASRAVNPCLRGRRGNRCSRSWHGRKWQISWGRHTAKRFSRLAWWSCSCRHGTRDIRRQAGRRREPDVRKSEARKPWRGASPLQLPLQFATSFAEFSLQSFQTLRHAYFIPRSVRTFGFSSPVARTSWQAEQSLVMVWPSLLV